MKFYLTALYKTLYSRLFYITEILPKNILGIYYILLVSFIVSITFANKAKNEMLSVFDYNKIKSELTEDYSKSISSQLPEIYYDNGKFSFSNNQLTKIRVDSTSDLIVIDPKDKITDYQKYPNTIILKTDKIVYNSDNKELVVFTPDKTYDSFSPYFSLTDSGYLFEKEKFFKDISLIFNISYPVIFLISYIIISIKYLIWVFVFSNIAFFIFYIRTKPLGISNKILFRISAFTVTPVALFDILRNSILIEYFMYPIIISAIIHIIYINYIAEIVRIQKL